MQKVIENQKERIKHVGIKKNIDKYLNRDARRLLTAGFLDSEQKRHVRTLLPKWCIDPRKIFDLPGVNGLSTKKIIGIFPNAQVHCLEKNKGLYMKAKKEFRNQPKVWLSNDTFANYVSWERGRSRMDYDAPFDLMFMDFTCVVTKPVEQAIYDMFQSKFKRGGVVAFTFCKGHDAIETVMDTYMYNDACGHCEKWYRANRGKAISRMIIAMAAKGGYRLKKLDTELPKDEYNSSGRGRQGSTMFFLMFKVVGKCEEITEKIKKPKRR